MVIFMSVYFLKIFYYILLLSKIKIVEYGERLCVGHIRFFELLP